MAGFTYRYRLGGGDPTLRRFATANSGFAAGDMLNFAAGALSVGTTGDAALLGAVHEVGPHGPDGHTVTVVVDGDAVYGVLDPNPRARGAALDLTGVTGGHGVAAGRTAELTVVADSAADEETLVRITIGKHHRQGDPEGNVTGGELNAAIARAVVRHHRETLGRGPTKAQAFYRGSIIVVILHGTMTKAERSLVAADHGDSVVKMRQAFQDAMRPELSALVEDLTGCTVVASMSTHHLEPDIAAQLFVLDRPVPGEAA
jgi:uncharacterized protein YbcI